MFFFRDGHQKIERHFVQVSGAATLCVFPEREKRPARNSPQPQRSPAFADGAMALLRD
jgi:hypothetical protein